MVKHKIENIIFVLDGYPYGGSSACVFARNLIIALADMGVNCTVITPQIITPHTIRKHNLPYFHMDYSTGGKGIPVYAPGYVYYPANSGLTTLSMQHHFNAVFRTVHKEKILADAVYGHFIFQCGLTAAKIGKKLGIPSFLGAGESDKLLPGNMRNHGVYERGVKKLHWKEILNDLSGIISVSEWTKYLLLEYGFLDTASLGKIIVCPNAVNQSVFYPADKQTIRKRLQLPEDEFITLFVGAFNENKGVLRVSKAIQQVGDVKSVFLGDGALQPVGEGILFCGSCDNQTVAQYMQAVDCFVLPTRNEGCCNAILEALSCGLPVISSDLPFNEGILDERNSIKIDPDDVGKLASAIRTLKENQVVRNRMAEGAAASAKGFGIEQRAERIIRFMSEVADNA